MKWFPLILLFLLLLPSVQAMVTFSPPYTFTLANNNTVVMGASNSFFLTGNNGTWLRLDQSYNSKHHTEYYLSITSSSDSLIINSWFPTLDSSNQSVATLTATTALTFNLYSPNFQSEPNVYGANIAAWTSNTLSINTVAGAFITITATVNQTAYNGAPENVSVEITNMDAGNWIFSESEFYDFRALYWDGDGYTDLDIMKIAFTDGTNWINASYNNGFTLTSGTDQALLSGSTTVIDVNEIQVDFNIKLTKNILDTENVDLYMYCIDTSGAHDGWELIESDYFNIYNVGGHVTYEIHQHISPVGPNLTAGRIEGGDWNNLYAMENTWAKASIVFRNLKYVDAIFALDTHGNISGGEDDNMAEKGYFYFGFDFNIEGTWIDGWYVRLELLDIDQGGGWPISTPANWAVYNATWWYHGVFVKYDYLACWYEGIAATDYRDAQRFHVRLWFNKANSSSVVGGWVNEVFYGYTPSGNWMWSGSAGPKYDAQNAANAQARDSFLFTDLTDANGNIISSTQVDFVRFWLKVERNTQESYIYQIKSTDMLNFNIGNDMYGVDTPAPIEPTLPAEAQSGGILGWLGNVFGGLWKIISDALGPSLLGFWNTFVAFLDSVFTALGWPNGFSQILNAINGVISWITSGLNTLLAFLLSIFSFMTGTFVGIFAYFLSFINALSSFYGNLVWIWESTLPYWGWIPGVLTQLIPLIAFFLALWIFLFPFLEGKGFHNAFMTMKERIELTLGTIYRLVMFIWRIIDFAIDTIYRIAEMIPVVE